MLQSEVVAIPREPIDLSYIELSNFGLEKPFLIHSATGFLDQKKFFPR